ncbi:MAG TPA: hypothetical protein VGO01_20830 [Bradyrhizobium sp.]|jgi:hypothetical protein|nr:hypothetical protein [Bradyrhizobium sp.]
MFVGAEFPHLGERAREARQRARAAFRFGAPRRVDVATPDDHFDLRQFTLDGAGDALDQRDTCSGWRVIDALGGGTPAEHLPLGNRGARRFILRIDRDRFGADVHPVSRQRLLALLNRGVAFAFQGPA